ncbi:MAG TPA: nucleotidyltransferase family protein [Bacillales bacterium]|nr:nucleotidyltransferase family protein [Bacillales bacterium]
MNELEQTLAGMIEKDPRIMRALRMVRQLNLPEGCISAGMIRNFVWDKKHGYEKRTPLNDVDVLYYDPSDIHEETEKEYEHKLKNMDPSLPWSVKNEARMHLRNHDEPYQSVEDAMKHWAETATAVAVRLERDHTLTVIAPFGLEDLFGLVLREGPFVADKSAFAQRCADKQWLEIWPKLQLVDENMYKYRLQ